MSRSILGVIDFPWIFLFSLTTLKFPDFSRFPRWVATLPTVVTLDRNQPVSVAVKTAERGGLTDRGAQCEHTGTNAADWMKDNGHWTRTRRHVQYRPDVIVLIIIIGATTTETGPPQLFEPWDNQWVGPLQLFTTRNKLGTRMAVFWCQNVAKTLWRPGSAQTRWGSLQRPQIP